MDDTRKQELFPYFAYLYSQKLNPETYGKAQTMEEWTSLIQENTEDIDKITAAAEQLSDEDWDSLDQQYSEQMETSSAQFAAKGAKLQKLKQGTKAKKKCKCGCEMVDSKAEGGKIISKCACGCNINKDKKGGVIVTPAPAMKKGKTIDRIGPKKEAVKPALKKGGLVKKQSGGDINTPNPSVAKCGGKVKNRIKKGQVGTKFSKPGEKPTAADTISKYNRMHINSDGFGPQNNQGKELKTKKEILNTARKEWKGKKVDVTKEKCGGKVKQRIQSKKN